MTITNAAGCPVACPIEVVQWVLPVAIFNYLLPGTVTPDQLLTRRAMLARPILRGYAHQPLATGILARDRFNLVRKSLDPLIEPAPIASQVFDDPHHAGRQNVRGCRQYARQLGAQKP